MKWWGWLVTAVGGSIMWGGLVLILIAADTIRDFHADELFTGGIFIICTLCVVVPLVQKAIKAAKEDK